MKKEVAVEVSLQEVLAAIWRKKWIILIATLLVAGGSFFLAKQNKSESYTQELMVYVVPKDGTGAENPVQYSQVADIAATDLKVYLKSKELGSRIRQSVSESELSNDDLHNLVKVDKEVYGRAVSFSVTAPRKEVVKRVTPLVLEAIQKDFASKMSVASIENWSGDAQVMHNRSSVSLKRIVLLTGIAFVGTTFLVVVLDLLSKLLKAKK
ncbi:hypothetical protein J7S27_01075 [Carnobacteriaceae bacterium zg-C25]|nr:hypothetical protein J7S27_01075 [Carnobacteriaceae bacterium zg-C25]